MQAAEDVMPRSNPSAHPGNNAEAPDLLLPRRYRRARRLAERGDLAGARRSFEAVAASDGDDLLRALATGDLATLAVLASDLDAARHGFRAALALDPACRPARLNLDLLRAEGLDDGAAVPPAAPSPGRVRVAILSLLFNWPSTGGGTVHNEELALFLQQAGYEVRHVYARHKPWGVGRVEGTLPYPAEPLDFDAASWTMPQIQAAFRRAVDAFAADWVIVTDSWNSKPLLAEAVRGYPTVLRLQALECLCPLNNVRLLPGGRGGFRQCPTHQLADPDACGACVDRFGQGSGSLHRAERALCGVGTPAYRESLRRAFREAEAVLVVNPLAAAMVGPHAKDVRVVTAGMDPGRFPWPPPARADAAADRPPRLLFAGLVEEPIKGFDVLHHACALLWERRQDFELMATADPPGRVDAFTRFVGWQSQDDLPAHIYDCDILMMPTVAQEALGRTAVEAMACGRPVIASRLGGLPFTVVDGATGLLCEPGDPADLARKIATLLDDPALRERLGLAGRKRFEEHYAWPVIIERHYMPLLGDPVRTEASVPRTLSSPALVPRPVAYAPHIPDRVDHDKLAADAASFFGLAREDVARMLDSYRAVHESKGYARVFGELKTLCFEEAFLLGLAMSLHRPRTIVEVGTQHGKSTRRILDLAEWLGQTPRMVCLDTTDQVRHFASSEAELVIGDVTGRFRRDVLEAYDPDLIFLDAHGHALLREAIAATMEGHRAVLAIHDCGQGLCNLRMAIAPGDPNVTSLTGVWERHVLADLLGVAGPLDPGLDALETATHRLRIFDTPHGLALIAPRGMTAAPTAESATGRHPTRA